MAAWWAVGAQGPQGPRAQGPPSPGQDQWRGDGEGVVGGRPPACSYGWVQGSPPASKKGQKGDGCIA